MKWGARGQAYEKVASTEPEEGGWEQRQAVPFVVRIRRNLATCLNIIFFASNIILFGVTLWTAKQHKSPNSLLRQTNAFSPLLDRFEFTFQKVKNNASLFNHPYSIYKDDPSPEVDAAWEDIADTPVLVIDREDVLKIGKDPEYAVAVPEEFGYGENKYFAVNDGQHLIHCLNEVRKFAYYDYYYLPTQGPASSLPALHAAHRSHCIGVLLDALTCQPSLNVVLFEYMEGQNDPWPDFDIWRQCQNHGQFFEWMNGLQVPREKIKGWDWSKGRGKERPMLEELKKPKGGGAEEGTHQEDNSGSAHGQGHGHGHDGTWS